LLGVVEYLIAKGVNVNSKDLFDNSPLHFAVQNNRISVVETLLKHGADPHMKNKENETPFSLSQMSPELKSLIQNQVKKTGF